jgi:hypothetical protein
MSTESRAIPILAEAGKLLADDRKEVYGDALHTCRRIGEVWAAQLDLPLPIPPHTVAAMMAGMKLIRSLITPEHKDSWVDAAAYAALGFGTLNP